MTRNWSTSAAVSTAAASCHGEIDKGTSGWLIQRPQDVLGLEELGKPEYAALAAEPALLVSAPGVITEHRTAAVDGHRPGADPVRDADGGCGGAPHVRRETVDRVVGERDGLVHVVVREHDADRAEQLVLRDLGAVIDAGDDGGLVVVALA